MPDDFSAGTQPDAAAHRDLREQVERAFRELPAGLPVAATLALVEEQSYEQTMEVLL